MKTLRTTIKSRIAVAAVAVSVPLLLLVGSGAAEAAPRFGIGCTSSTNNPAGTVCITTGATTRVSRTIYTQPATLCDARASLTFYFPDGTQRKEWRGTGRGCTTGGAWYDFSTNYDVPRGTKMCGSFFQGTNRDGTACRTV